MFGATTYSPAWGVLFTALLVVACVTDVRERRIPNALVVVILATGLAFSVFAYPLTDALLRSGSGLVLGFAIWIVFWLLGLLGAGDVKFFAATGAWLGPGATWRAALIAALFGGVLAVFVLVRERRLKAGMERTALAVSSASLSVLGSTSDNQTGKKRHLPYGVALAGGALVMAWMPRILA